MIKVILMRKLAMEAKMAASQFNDAGSCLGQVRQLLGALRAQLRDEQQLHGGNVTISILVKTDPMPQEQANASPSAAH